MNSARVPAACATFAHAASGPTSDWTLSQIEIDADRRMVGGFIAAAHFLVDRDARQPIGGLRRQQQMIDADAVVPLPAEGLEIPKRIEPAGIGGRAQGVGQAEIQEFSELGTRLR